MHAIYQPIELVKKNYLIELQKRLSWQMKEKRNDKACSWFTVVTLLFSKSQMHLLRLSSLLFCHCSRTIHLVVPLLYSSQLLRISALNVFLQKEKIAGWNTLARKYIFHLHMIQAKLKTINKETRQLFRKFCCLPYHLFPASIGAMHIYLFLLCAS